MSFVDRLGAELEGAGIPRRLRRRIVAEFEDHLASEPDADLGDPRDLARQFADELGSSRTLRAGMVSFGALALAGTLFAVAFITSPHPAFGAAPAHASLLGRLATAVALLAPQVAFVAGVLALLRVLQRRRVGVVAAAESRVIVRRAATGLAAGLASMAAMALIAVEYRAQLPGWWATLALIAAGVGAAALIAATPALLAAVRLAPVAAGSAGDVFDDLGKWAPEALRGRPWRLALIVAGLVALAITLFGVLASDGYDGALRGIADALICLLGFATLGRYLGLWSPRRA